MSTWAAPACRPTPTRRWPKPRSRPIRRLYPTAKVIGGYDFVGSSWPNTAEIPDPNPMDDQAGGTSGHGTHVSSIIGGVATPDLGPGVAPGVELYALKVCSSISTSCSGLALMQAHGVGGRS